MATNSWKRAVILLLSLATLTTATDDQLISAVDCDIATEAGICLFGGTPFAIMFLGKKLLVPRATTEGTLAVYSFEDDVSTCSSNLCVVVSRQFREREPRDDLPRPLGWLYR